MRRAYLFIGRALTPFALIGLRAFTKLTGRERVRVIVTNEENEVLLLKGVISHRQWTLPGGGVNRNENTITTARRELQEETGIVIPESSFEYIRTVQSPDVKIPFKAPLFRVTVRKSDLPDKMVNPVEIAAIGWFKRDELPVPLSAIATFALIKIND